MRKIYKYISILIPAVLLLLCAGCSGTESKTVKIAVMGNPEQFHAGYAAGIKRAESDLNSEYADTGYTVVCEWYTNDGSYSDGASKVDSIADDKSITAVLADTDMDVNEVAARMFDDAGKLFVVPFALYESVYDENSYDKIFSMCYSGKQIGECLKTRLLGSTGARRWAVCATDNSFEQEKANGFLNYRPEGSLSPTPDFETETMILSGDEEISRDPESAGDASAEEFTVQDCVSMEYLQNNFNKTCKRWNTLGIDGVVMFSHELKDSNFELLKKLKNWNPDIALAGDSGFDDQVRMRNDGELSRIYDSFEYSSDFERSFFLFLYKGYDVMLSFADESSEEDESASDTWTFHAYDAVRMIGDTAIRSRTSDPGEIARLLHKNGYIGTMEWFLFDENGERLFARDISEEEYPDFYGRLRDVYNSYEESHPEEATASESDQDTEQQTDTDEQGGNAE